MAGKVIELTSSKSQIVYKILPDDDPKQRMPDIQKAQSVLNWTPKVFLDEGLTKTIDYHCKILKK